MPVVVDTGPLVAALFRRDEDHGFAAALVAQIGSDMLVPGPVATEVDVILRRRDQPIAARRFLAALGSGELQRTPLTDAAFARAVEIDERYADLDLGIVDASVMALAETTPAQVLTFDFGHFRATTDRDGRPWRLLVDEDALERSRRRK